VRMIYDAAIVIALAVGFAVGYLWHAAHID
jgi:hypothetical protein